ncbi:MAG TPA: DUF2267 domain-containing protein [Cryomorphaceae bacterium]|nr:DUF2267 domain-containing protein [Cryomorphaceae bacterium]
MNNIDFDKHRNEANAFINELSKDLGHPDEQPRAYTILKAVMHTIRDRITISESFDVMAQLPFFLKAIYVDQWKYSEKPPRRYDSIEEMKQAVKDEQAKRGETQFEWDQPTEEIISAVMNRLKEYLTEGQMEHIRDQMPKEVKELIA